MSERTFVIIKPDAVSAGHVGVILARYEGADLDIERLDLRTIDGEFADRHYAEHLTQPWYPPLKDFMTSGPLVALVLSGDDAIAAVRRLNGATDPAQAEAGTIRAEYATSVRLNAVHGSDSVAAAEREIALWFPN